MGMYVLKKRTHTFYFLFIFYILEPPISLKEKLWVVYNEKSEYKLVHKIKMLKLKIKNI